MARRRANSEWCSLTTTGTRIRRPSTAATAPTLNTCPWIRSGRGSARTARASASDSHSFRSGPWAARTRTVRSPSSSAIATSVRRPGGGSAASSTSTVTSW